MGVRSCEWMVTPRRVVLTLAQAPNCFERFNVGRILEPAGALGFDEVVDPDQGNPLGALDQDVDVLGRARVRKKQILRYARVPRAPLRACPERSEGMTGSLLPKGEKRKPESYRSPASGAAKPATRRPFTYGQHWQLDAPSQWECEGAGGGIRTHKGFRPET